MPTLTLRPLLLSLGLVLGAPAVSAQTCSQWVDYPMTVDYHTPQSLAATEASLARANARFGAVRVIDEAMKVDLDASVAAGCKQEVRDFLSQGRVYTTGYCTAMYSMGSTLQVLRPSTGRQWYLDGWSEYETLPKFGGEIAKTYRHKNAAPLKLAGRGRVGDEVWVVASGSLEVFCFGDPDSIADRGEASYGWGAAPAPVVRLWLP